MNNRLIIVGSAPCLEEDLAALFAIVASPAVIPAEAGIQSSCDFMAIGLDCAARFLGRIEHCATYHPFELPDFRARRAAAGGNLDYRAHSHEQYRDASGKTWVDQIWYHEGPSGSSTLLGVRAGLALGYERIIVAGAPLVDPKYTVENEYRRGWEYWFDKIKDKTRSMSGWTRELLGAPTGEWLLDSPLTAEALPDSPSPVEGEGRVRVDR